MATRIRLQRRGRKGYAFYSIVIADARAPRDGRFIEKIGTYNPNTNPAAVDLNFERALHWVLVGAQPTDTVRNLLSREGVYMKKHLLGGVAKGAFNEAEAETKFEAWKNDKQNGLKALKDKIDADKKAAAKVRLEAEKKVNEEIAAKVAEKKAAEAATKAAEEAATKVAEAEEAKAEEAKVAEEAKATEETTTTLPTEEAAPVEEAPKTEA
ncbi:30S ribosomal protein S16 [Phocaeicola abscessus]|uniref:30S ribosomal protein S16 n=1 Tax=Phocaeicola abscessus TaxID=555313 RepID=UPI0028F02997|nr:30S ribosomal protein S16 [Phocaeicola abscessus]